MAQEGADTLTCHAPELAGDVDEYVQHGGYDSRNQALKDIIRTGLRESRAPLLTRWRERVIDWAGLLGLFAMLFVAAGVAIPPITPLWGIQMAAVIITIALAMLAVVEVARVWRGQSRLGQDLMEVFP